MQMTITAVTHTGCPSVRIVALLLAGGLAFHAGCEKQRIGNATAPAAAAPPAVSSEPAEEPPGEVVPRPTDAEDAASAPRALPRSSELVGWIKTEPVRVASGNEVARFVDDDRIMRVLRGYAVQQAARCTYRSADATARVLLIEMASPADAFGAFSMLYPHAGCTVREDGSLYVRTNTQDGVSLAACQGGLVVQVQGTAKDAERGMKDCDRLVARIIFSVPAADPPLLVQAVREMQASQCELWMVRKTSPLNRLDHALLRKLDAAKVDSRLGLTGEATLSVVSIAAAEDGAPTVMWLAEYPTAQAAQAAAERYRQATQPAEDVLDKSTLMGAATGRVLVGTWTAEQEIARDMVRSLTQILSKP